MWYELHVSPRLDPDYADSVAELMQTTSRRLIFITVAAFIAWFIGMPDLCWFDMFASTIFVITPVLATACGLSLWLLPRRPLAAQVTWQVGLALATVLAVYVFQEPAIVLLCALLPLMAAVTVGRAAGLLAEGLVIALVWWLTLGVIAPPLSTFYALITILGGALAGTFGWASVATLVKSNYWLCHHYDKAQEQAELARNQRMELKQVQEDLIHANQELTRLSDRLKAMRQIAEEARRAKEEFVANVSHELRTPLNMIIGFSEMIPRLSQVYGTRLPPVLLSDIAAIRRNSQHLARLVDDVLDLSQVEAGRLALSKEWTCLQEIIDGAVTAVRALFDSKGLYLHMEMPADLPAVFCDATRVRQVIINLLSNAGRFTESGGVRVKAWHEGDQAIVSVSDTGPGITAADQERLFQPFQQLDSSVRRRQGGSGLGLSISKQLVEMHEGRMWLESEVSVGTTFYFSLPLEKPLAATVSVDDYRRWFNPYWRYEGRTRPFKIPASTVAPRFVLLEKGYSLQRLFKRYMEGADIVAVQSADRALQELAASPAQALVINYPLSEALSILRGSLADLPYETPVISCWVPGEVEAAKRLGVTSYLVKPITHEALLDALEALGDSMKDVLLVDDDPEALQLFTRMLSLSPHGYRVIQAKNGQRALTLLRERRPDVVLLDLVMPGLDGFQVLEEMSQDSTIREIPVIVITSRDPGGQPVLSDALVVTRGEGLSVSDLLACVRATSEILAPTGTPAAPSAPQEPSGTPPA